MYVHICLSRGAILNCSERWDFWATAERVIDPDQIISADCSFADLRDALVMLPFLVIFVSNSADNGVAHVSLWTWRRLGSSALVPYYSILCNEGNNAAPVDLDEANTRMTDSGKRERTAFACCLRFAGGVAKGNYPDELVQENSGDPLVPVDVKVLATNNT